MVSNNLPVRVRLPRDRGIGAWLKDLQTAQSALQEHASSPLPLVRECAAIAPDEPLFECLLVFQNDPAAEALGDGTEFGLKAHGVGGHSRTNYPVTVMVTPGARLEIACMHDRSRAGTTWTRR